MKLIFKSLLKHLNKRILLTILYPILFIGQNPALSKIAGPESIQLKYVERFVYKVFGASSSGSGLLILLPDSKVALITAKHVISGMGPNEEIEIQVNEKKNLYVEKSNVIDMPNYDLAFVLLDRKELEIDLDNTYYLTEIESTSSLVGQNVSVAGFPLSDKSIVNKARVSPGIIQTIGDSTSKDGYSLGYSSKTYVGMSGGGVFSANGKLIGIHGRGEAIKSDDVNKTGTNYAVLVKDAIKFYRSISKADESDLGLTEASRLVLDGNFNPALKIWENIS